MSILFFDLETQKLAEEVGGWGNKHLMKMSVGVVYNEDKDEFKVYHEKDVNELLKDLKEADLVVGFNLLSFDYEVLKDYGYTDADFAQIKTFDILDYIRRKYGFRISLDNIALGTLRCKNNKGNGIEAVKWWQEGKIDKIIEYCKEDVRITRDIFYFGEQNWYIKYWDDRSATRKRLDVEWAGMRNNKKGGNMSKIVILKTNWANDYWSQERPNAPYQRQFINLPLDELRRLLPLPAIGIYLDGDRGDFSREPFQFMKIIGVSQDGEEVKFHTIPLPAETIASVQVPRRTHNLFEVVERPQQIITWLDEQGVNQPPEWLELINRQQPQQINQELWQDWIGKHFKRLSTADTSPDKFEDIVAATFRALGFDVEKMGHTKPGKPLPDGVLKAPNTELAFVYDCKNSSNYYPNTDDKRALREYLGNQERKLKEKQPNLRVYPYFIAKSFADNQSGEAELSVDNILYVLYKRLKLGNKFSLIPFEEAWKCKRIDKKFIDDHWPENGVY